MAKETISLTIEMADRTRRAQVTVPRKMKAIQIVKVCRKNWSLPFGVDYQVANMRTGRLLLLHDTLENLEGGDTLLLQPFPVHGAA